MSPGPLYPRRHLEELARFANEPTPPGLFLPGEDGKVAAKALCGIFQTGLLENMRWTATEATDGQIEVGLSYPNKRPNNWEVMRAFREFGWRFVFEDSRATGKMRMFVVQRGA